MYEYVCLNNNSKNSIDVFFIFLPSHSFDAVQCTPVQLFERLPLTIEKSVWCALCKFFSCVIIELTEIYVASICVDAKYFEGLGYISVSDVLDN